MQIKTNKKHFIKAGETKSKSRNNLKRRAKKQKLKNVNNENNRKINKLSPQARLCSMYFHIIIHENH